MEYMDVRVYTDIAQLIGSHGGFPVMITLTHNMTLICCQNRLNDTCYRRMSLLSFH